MHQYQVQYLVHQCQVQYLPLVQRKRPADAYFKNVFIYANIYVEASAVAVDADFKKCLDGRKYLCCITHGRVSSTSLQSPGFESGLLDI